MTSQTSTCATHGTVKGTQAQESSASKAKSSQSNQVSLSNVSVSEQQELSASRIASYLEDRTASHIQPQHISSQESLRILSMKKCDVKALEDILNNRQE